MKEKMKEIAQRISELRELTGISKGEMAEYLNIPLNIYSGYEDASSDIPASILFEIAHKLNVDMGLLLLDPWPRSPARANRSRGADKSARPRRQLRRAENPARFG